MLVHSMRAAEIARSEGEGREAAVGEIGGIAGCDESVGLAQTFRHGAQHSGAVGDQATDQRGILGGLEGWPVGLACSIWIGNSPDHGIIGTASLEDLEDLRSGRQR